MSASVKWILGIVVLAVLVWIGMSMSEKAPTETGPIKVGFIGPLSGDAAAYGEPIANGLRLAEKEINDAGGVDGRPVEIIYEDSKCSGSDAASAAQKLISIDGVKFIVGGVCSSEVYGYVPITNPAEVITITPGGSAPGISELGDYVFRNSTNDARKGVTALEYVAPSHKTVAIITEKTELTTQIRGIIIARAQELGLQVSADEEVIEGASDFRTVLSKIKSTNPEILYINIQTPATLIRIAQQARDLGITAQFLSTDFTGPEVVNAGPALDGIILSVAPGLTESGKGQDLVNAYRAMFGEEPPFAFYVGAAYDALHLFVQGIEKHGEDTAKVRDYLYGVDYEGTIGRYSFDANGDIEGVAFVLQKLTNGVFSDL